MSNRLGTHEAYKETNQKKLSDRRSYHKLVLLHRIVNNNNRKYLQDVMPGYVSSRHDPPVQYKIIFY